MINTLLEHVPIKMEAQDIEETNGIPNNPPQDDGIAKDDENIDETDEDVDADDGSEVEEDDDDDDVDEEEEEESDIETDALEIEKEATMLISSDEEAELEAQRIRFPDIVIAKKLRRDSNISSCSSSSFSPQPHITYEIVKHKDCPMEDLNNKQRISPRLNQMEHKSLESCGNKENNNKKTKILLKQKTENQNLDQNKCAENSKTTKPDESHKQLDNRKATEVYKSCENKNLLKSSPEQKSRRCSNNSTCSVASTVASDSAETESCGNIYVFNLEQKLIFNCEFCDLKYGDLNNFALHLHEAHKLFNFDEDPEKENAPRNLGKNKRHSISSPKNNAVNVKKEPLQYADLKAEPPIALPPSALAEPLDSCGNVFMLNNRKLFLICGYCETKYANLELFEKHLRQQHRLFEGCYNEVNVVPKVEVKEELAVTSELANKTDLAIPQAMVAIPAEIPLNISITQENDQEIVTAAEAEKATVNVQQGATTVEKSLTLKETSALEEIVVKQKVIAELDTKEQIVELDKDKSLFANKAEGFSSVNAKQSTNDIIVKALDTDIEMLDNGDTEKTVIRKGRNKRPSSADKQLESPNKRPKRTTRNNPGIEEESPVLYEANNTSTASLTIAEPIMEEQNCPELTKLIICGTKTPQSFKIKTAEIETQEKTFKTTISLETEIFSDVQNTPTRELHKTPEFEKATSLKKTPTRDLNRIPEYEKTIHFKKTPTRDLNKLLETEKVRTLINTPTRDLNKTPEHDKMSILKAADTLQTEKVTDCEKSLLKHIENTDEMKTSSEKAVAIKCTETKKSKKSTLSNKTTATNIKVIETKDTKKTSAATKSTSSKSAESKEIRKKKESEQITTKQVIEDERPIALKSTEAKETRKRREMEKTNSLQHPEIRETRTSTKRAAKDNPALEIVEPKKQSPISKSNRISPEQLEDKEMSEMETNKLKCCVCFKEFAKKKALICHERTHHIGSNTRYGCGICGKDFQLENERKSHMLARHNANEVAECNLCCQAFGSDSVLERHNEKFHAETLFKCNECQRTYSSRNSLKSHLYMYHNSAKKSTAKNKKKFERESRQEALNSDQDEANAATCIKTDEQILENVLPDVVDAIPIENSAVIFALENDLNAKPISIVNEASLSDVELLNLNESTDANDVINLATNTAQQTIFVADLHNQTNNHEMVLPIPTENISDSKGPTNSKKQSTTTSTLRGGNEEDDPAADPVNDIMEQLQNELTRSSLESTTSNNVVTYTINSMPNGMETQKTVVLDAEDRNEDIKPTFLKIVKHFVCDICSKTYYKHSRLIEHKRLHTGEKPFGCDECGKQFRVRNRLNEHKQRHSKEKKFKCEICQLPLCTRQDYNLHMRHHTNDRRHQCTVCSKAFVRSSDLKIHERIHTGEKPYVCDICNKCFRANQNLSVHKKSHMGDLSKTFQCEFCDKKFMRKIDRKVHMRTHTGEKPYKCEICQRGYSSRVNVRAHIDRDHIKGSQEEKKKPGPKPRSLREELERQKKLIEELQNQLLQQIKTDEKIILSDEEIQGEHILPDSPVKVSSPTTPATTNTKSDPVQSAYKLLNKLKASSLLTTTTTSKSLTVIPSPPPLNESPSSPLSVTATKDTTTTLLPLTITQKLEQASPAISAAAAASTCATTSPTPQPPVSAAPNKTTATKVVSQKTSLGIQQVSVTVSMQVENVSPGNSNAGEKEVLTTSPDGGANLKKERKITSYFTVLDQKSKG